MEYLIQDIKKEEIDAIRPVWEQLNAIHLRDSVHFKEHYGSFTFEDRKKAFASMDGRDIKITLVTCGGEASGYCVSTIRGDDGEIESLYLMDSLRDRGLGKKLVESHVAWMRERACARIRVSVAHGHESVLGFYRKLGFKDRLTVLEYTGRE